MWRAPLLWLVVFFICVTSGVTGALVVPLVPSSIDIKVGDVAPRNIEAPRKIRFVSSVLTLEAQQKARDDPSNRVYIFDASSAVRARSTLSDLIRQIGHARASPDLFYYQREEIVRKAWPTSLSEGELREILSLPGDRWGMVTAEALRVLDLAMSGRFEAAELEGLRARIPDMVRPDLSGVEATLVADLVKPLLRSTVVLDEQATRRRQDDAAAREVVYVELQPGESILRKGDVVKPLDLEKLQAAGLTAPSVSWSDALGLGLLSALLVGILSLYLRLFCSGVLQKPNLLALLALILVLTVLVGRVTIPGHSVLPYLLPMASVGMLVTVLIDVQLAVVATGLLSVLLGVVAGNSLELACYYLAGALAGVMSIWRAERSLSFAWAGLLVGVVSAGVALAMRLLSRDLDLLALGQLAGIGVGNGILSAALAFGTFSVLGSVFGVTTVIQLLELAHPSHPLLKRLVVEAPGTYHHSLLVGNLAERAATAVGADALLARVGAYYHDVGKLVRPYFFVENQTGRDNPHDGLDPATSARILMAHVADGVQMARQARLPKKIVEMIQQHHGTSLMAYFFHKALIDRGSADEADFRYPGPKPHSKEAAILMLADSVEATVRASVQGGKAGINDVGTDSGDDSLETIVDRVVQQKLDDGQLDESELTLQDLRAIRAAFVQILRGAYHPRVEYPELPSKGQLKIEL
jgi:putative nucleotidyltransferase with HDIG domain